MTPFTYLLKHLPTNKYYYGVRFKKNCNPNDLWTKYFTSSKKVKGLIRKYGKKSFQFEIRKTFKTAKQAMNWEHKVLRRMKVIYRNDFLNQTDNKSIDPKTTIKANTGRKGYWLGKTFSKETRKKISISKKGKNNPRYGVIVSKETREKRSKTLKQRYKNPNNIHPWLGKKHKSKTIKKIRLANIGKNNPMYGKKLTKLHRKRLSKSGIKAWERRKAA